MRTMKNILSSPVLRLNLILLVFYFSQIYPYYHFHHNHTEGLFNFVVSAHPIDIEVDHDNHHHHHDDDTDSPQPHNQFEKFIDWHITRVQQPQFDLPAGIVLSSIKIPADIDDQNFYAVVDQIFDKDAINSLTSLTYRGPPRLS